MTAGIVGLGLIGGSLAKAYHEAGERVLAHDHAPQVVSFALKNGPGGEARSGGNLAE